jgi:hypothetical protein
MNGSSQNQLQNLIKLKVGIFRRKLVFRLGQGQLSQKPSLGEWRRRKSEDREIKELSFLAQE